MENKFFLFFLKLLWIDVVKAKHLQHASTPDTLFHKADEALYQAKREGRDLFRILGETPSVKDTSITTTDVDSLFLTKEGRMAIGMIDRILQQGSELEPL